MTIDWLLIEVVALNSFFSTICDMCAKYWGITGSQYWLYAGLAINLFTVFFYMYAIRLGGLAITTSVILLITIAISVALGFFFFHEQVHLSQWIGIGVGFVAITLISGALFPTR
ncbi:MAG TPA: EamA family transporter [Candidatus Paceibacterota bacterium]|jgi:drug/metabolite transporter (DMT)-like permease|nr:EamA family transporter [Candidatus Paceibacterota bacterium]